MKSKKINVGPLWILLIINILALVLLYFSKEEIGATNVKLILGFIVIIFVVNLVLSRISLGDNYLFLLVSFLSSIGIIMVFRIDRDLGIKQIIFNLVGIFVFFLTYFLLKKMKNWDKYTVIYLVLSIVLFVITLIFGSRRGGAKNWIVIGLVNIQPSEIIKILYVMIIASFYSHRERIKKNIEKRLDDGKKLKDTTLTLILLGICYLFIGLLFLQTELGIALLFFLTFNTIMYVYEPNRKILLLNIVIAIFMAIVGYYLFSHVRLRVDIWLDPWKDFSSRGFQIVQSLFAIAEGGFFGTGLGLGNPEFVPEVHNDFIFSAICEEMGILTGIAIVLVYMMIVYRGIKISLKQQNRFLKILSLGLSASFGFQAFIILGGVIGMIPLTGVTLPFISYGGSSLVSSFITLALIQLSSENITFIESEEVEIETEEVEEE